MAVTVTNQTTKEFLGCHQLWHDGRWLGVNQPLEIYHHAKKSEFFKRFSLYNNNNRSI
jgi:hypothetical protein